MTKMTYASALTSAIENGNLTPEVIEKLSALREQISKKHDTIRKPTANQVANEGLKNVVIEILSDGSAKTISEMIKANEKLSEISNQRLSAIVRQMVEDKVLNREEVKRKAYFSLAV